jgi:lipoprotein-anchoring transpeptidase ErfK/SrfK
MHVRRLGFVIVSTVLWAAEKNPPLTIDPNQIGSTDQAEIHAGDKGPGVVRAQILLGRAHFSCGQIDGNFGTNLEKTVSAFQQQRKLPVSGRVDAATWVALNTDRAPLLISYSISDKDEKGPFVQVPQDVMEQAKLPYLGYSSPLDELSERFHSSPELMKALNPGADFSNAGTQLTVPNVLVMPPGGAGAAALVVVSKSDSSVRAYDDRDKLLAFYVATIGSGHDPLPLGDWRVEFVKRDPVFDYDASLFWDAKDKSGRAEIKPGPRNPVGAVWIDLSKEHYGIHGTPDASLIGHAFSHGCIRLTNWDARELAEMVKPGIEAVLKE